MEQQLVIREEQAGLSLTLRDVVVMGFRHKLLLLLCFFGILVGVVLFVLVWPNYQSQTEFLLRRDRVDPVVTPGQNTPMLVNNAVTEEELNSEVELIKSFMNGSLRRTHYGASDAAQGLVRQGVNHGPASQADTPRMLITV